MLNGFIPFKKSQITYLHYAILNDAPVVVTSLVKYGTDVYEGTCDYPDLEPLYLALASPHDNYRDLDKPLWIASSYALPRSCEYLLERGASPNNLSNFGMGAMHLAGQLPNGPLSFFAQFQFYFTSAEIQI
ncbi:hypothetical protein N7471_013469 [Penicillium samsonianum]|uniref:uncharacterized protein n=1 Tax=Penicillium samsonianum TaxID=1882272 RepID=UPI0025499919|nr:uncharacterized protein N7471_013469 [Penicillium samsonianum]KAJ6118849.1 hypothetical protein N7471_013469 [Penicillium samsonianum]